MNLFHLTRFNVKRAITLMLFPLSTAIMPAYAEEHVEGRLFFQVRITDMQCQLDYDKYTLIDTRNYVDSPANTTFGYGIDAGTIFKIGENSVSLIVEPVIPPVTPSYEDRYCEIKLMVGVNKGGKQQTFELPFNVAFDKDGNPYSLDKGEMDFPNPEVDPKNEITIHYKESDNKAIETIVLTKSFTVDFKD